MDQELRSDNIKKCSFYDDLLPNRSKETHKKSISVVCIDLNPQPEWRLPNGDVLPECYPDKTKTKNCK